VSLVDPVLGLARLGYAGDRSGWPQVMLGISIQVATVLSNREFTVTKVFRREHLHVMGYDCGLW
jgi:hypothetical protein